VLVVLAARCTVEGTTPSKKTRDYNAARAMLLCIAVITWLTIIAWQHEQGTWYPASTWDDGYVIITSKIDLAWYLMGMLGVLSA
jgi:hypothetical protein